MARARTPARRPARAPRAASNGHSPAAVPPPDALAFDPIDIPLGTRRLLANVLVQVPTAQAIIKAFGDDHGIPEQSGCTLVIDAAHLEHVVIPPPGAQPGRPAPR